MEPEGELYFVDESDPPRALIQAVPVDEIVALSAQWAERDKNLSDWLKAIDGSVKSYAASARSTGVTPEQAPSTQYESAGEAIAAMDAARGAIAQAQQAEAKARQTLQDAEKSVESALLRAHDVLIARRAIVAIIVVLGVLLAMGFLGEHYG